MEYKADQSLHDEVELIKSEKSLRVKYETEQEHENQIVFMLH